MGYSQAHIDETRQRILEAAGRLMRRHGLAGVSISKIMSEAKLTHGGFYAHFRSKDELFAAMIGEDFDFTNQLRRLMVLESLGDTNRALIAANYYLDPENSDKVAPACTLASSSQDVARSGEDTQAAFTRSFQRLIEAFGEASGEPQSEARDRQAMGALATCVGGLIISRALNDDALSTELLAASQEAVRTMLKPADGSG